MLIYLLFICISIILCKTENEIDIKDAGVGFIAPDDMAMIFYVTLKNNCDRNYEISVCMLQCCENSKPNENFCGHMTLVGGYMGVLNSKTCRNITLLYPNLYLFNRQGVCTVAIKYQNLNSPQEITTEVEFKTGNCEDPPQCPTVDLDPFQNCNPVECVAKYSGGKNYFNTKTRECECIPVCAANSPTCDADIAYSLTDNTCVDIHSTMNMTDLELLEKNDVDMTECEQATVNTIVCHQGYMDTTGKCVCHHDWVTTTDDEIYEPSLLLYHMCNIEAGAWSCINKGRIRTTALLIAIFALTIASKILILMCILNWFYRRLKHKPKICTDHLDRDRESLLLCETLSSAEKCLCDEIPKNKKNLHSQTVNVGFYPCFPSGYSSVKASSYSERSRFGPKSDQSILLSHTTSSSMPVSFQSETEATTEDSECECPDEENYEIEFSVEGDEDYLEELAHRPEEAYGEDGKSKEEEAVMGEDKTDASRSGGVSVKETEGSGKGTSSSKSKSQSEKSKSSSKEKSVGIE